MAKITDVLRLRFGPLPDREPPSHREIARLVGLSHPTVKTYLARAERAGVATWPLPPGMQDADVEALLAPPTSAVRTRPLPDWQQVHDALTDPKRKKSATLQTQWEAYAAQHPDTHYAVTQFKTYYRRWAKQHAAVLRFEHQPGDRLYVDFAGVTMEVVDRETGEVKRAQIFVAVLGYSQRIYAEAVWSQQLPDWIHCHVNAFAFYGGVTRTLICDNLRSAVTKAHRYEPDLNPTYWECATHYNVIVLPARARKPRDKALGELAVKLVTQRVLDPLMSRTFHSLSELNVALTAQLARLNARPFQQKEGTRDQLFTQDERSALQPLPASPYEYAEYKDATVGPDYHVLVQKHHYSVPYELIGTKVQVRITARTIEVLQGHARVAAHLRSATCYGFTTNAAHRPERHSAYLKWTPERLHSWAEKIGPHVAALVGQILTRKYPHPDQGIRSCLGLLSLARAYSAERLDAACGHAVRHQRLSSRAVKSILVHGLDQPPVEPGDPSTEPSPARPPAVLHENVRGAEYFA